MESFKPLRVWLEKSVLPPLQNIVSQRSDQFELAVGPESAEVIIFEYDEPDYIRETPEFKQWPQKCIVVSERDEPTYFLPACYASNKRCLLSNGRTKTISYLMAQESFPHPFIKFFGDNNSRKYLYAFKGGSTSWVRKKLFRHPNKLKDVFIEEANNYLHWNYEQTFLDEKLFLQKQYAELLEQSSFFLCPQGAGVSSIRLFEVMQAGRVPVIIADKWVPVEDIPWSEFSLFIREKDLANIDTIIRSHAHAARELGLKAHHAWEQFCAPGADTKLLIKYIRDIQNNRSETRERMIRMMFPLLYMTRSFRKKGYALTKYLILRAYVLMGKKFPYSLNRPVEEQLKKVEKT